MNDSHRYLLRYQTTKELERKAKKAKSKHNLWTQEEIDFSRRKAAEIGRNIGWEHDEYDLFIDD